MTMEDRAVGLAIALVITGLVVSFTPSVFQWAVLVSVGAILWLIGLVQGPDVGEEE